MYGRFFFMLTLKPEQVLFSQGEPITGLFLIISGSFSLTFPGGEYTLSGGDVLGICELSGSTHFMTAQALENTSLLPCAVTDFASLKSFLAENTDYCSIFSRSAFRQIGCLFRYYEATEEKSNLLSAHPDVAAVLVGNVCKDTLSLLSSLKKMDEVMLLLPEDIPLQGEAEEEEAAAPVVVQKPVFQPADTTSLMPQLKNSLDIILTYVKAEPEFAGAFRTLVTDYRLLPDRNSEEPAAKKIRQDITSMYFELYKSCFLRASKSKFIPLPVSMFLYFGYVDEGLAGPENAEFLAHLAKYLESMPHTNVYTFYDWLLAILHGEKEPSRNEFDMDYTDYIHRQKVTGAITAEEELVLMKDNLAKVDYEFANMFPAVTKITFGRIASFCPVFSDHNLLKKPGSAFVTADFISRSLTQLESVDYSLFYREYTYSNMDANIPKEFFHNRILPDFILVPGIGMRSIMWQEIEGKRRSTPARFIMPIFYLDDAYTSILHLSAEYRWEMCKRVQGARWNDLSDRSLTSEYFDYIQFYRKNHDLSQDAKESIKTGLRKMRGSFKEMFIRDYISYVLFESAGSPRLTKPARSILFTYCTFSKEIRDRLNTNPIYKEMLDRLEIKQAQKLHKYDLLVKRVENAGKPLPEELVEEGRYLNM